MLYFTRWKALGIILTALVVCLCAVPNFFPEAQVKTWPAFAQRRLVLGLDLQGGSYLLLEVDANDVKTTCSGPCAPPASSTPDLP
jgi:preprotein translocase subunit SecD